MVRPVHLAVCVLTALAAGACAGVEPERLPTQLVVVMDGLRPDYVRADLMPNLHALGQRGVVFTNHHAVLPTVTRVNSASIGTGAYPGTHGLLGNSIFVPAFDSTRGVSTGDKTVLDGVTVASGGRLLTATTLGEVLQASGRTLLALSSGSEGSGLLLNPTVAGGAVIHPSFTLPDALRSRIDAALGEGPTAEAFEEVRTRWIVDAYLDVALDAIHPDVTILWMGTLDTVAHATGVGSPEAVAALASLDAELGRLEAGLRERNLLDRANILVTADHGFSTYAGGLDLDAIVEKVRSSAGGEPPAAVRADGAIYLGEGTGSGQGLLESTVRALQADEAVGAIFTAARERGSHEGIVPGTLSFDLARWNHDRAGDLLVSPNWSDAVNAHGYAGQSTSAGVAGHGSTSPYDIHATLIAAGPGFREGVEIATPTANVDIAPTLLRLLGLPVPETVDGRPIAEALRDGPSPESLEVTRTEVSTSVRLPDVEYAITAQTTTVGDYRYLDEVSVRRSQP